MATINFIDDETEVPASWLNDVDSHVFDDTTAVHTAAAITNVPAGGIAATTVQAAIDELDTEKAPLASPTFTGTVTTAALSGTTGTFSGAISGTTGTFTGAVSGTTITGSGIVRGNTATGFAESSAVVGIASSSGYGIYGSSVGSNGIFGISTTSAASGVYGKNSSNGIGVTGESNSLYGVKGTGGVAGGNGVWGVSYTGYGVVAETGYGGTTPSLAAFRIVPQDAEPPGANSVGDIYITTAGVVKECTVAGTPGTWVSVGGAQNDAKFTTGITTGTFTSGQLTGAGFVVYENTQATPGSIATRTATLMFSDNPHASAGYSYYLRITNNQGTGTLTVTAGTGVTLTGTMTIAINTYRDFIVTYTSSTALVIQQVGIGTSA